MTREKCKQLLPIIQAFVDGKEIECRVGNDAWFPSSNPDFSELIEYRIKPTIVKKLVPLTFEDMLVGTICTSKSNQHRVLIIQQNKNGVWFQFDYHHDYEDLLENYTFLDGSHCGKYIEVEE